MKEKVKVPELRFSGFTDDWEERKLGDVFSERSERSGEGELISVTINSGVIRASELNRTDNSSDDKSNYKKVEVGDIAYNSMRMWQGASGYSPYEGILSPAYTVIFPKEGIDSKFFSYDFKRYDMIQTFKRNSQGLTSDTLNLKFPTLKSVKVMIPCFEEQKQISNFFESVDKTIALHQRKLDLLKEQKKGYLQKMFPKNGSKIPELRFEGFTDDWELRKFGEMLVNLEAGVSVNSSDYDTGYFILKTSAIKMGNIDLLEVKSIVSEEVARAKTPLIKNSIIISRMNTPELVGASGLVRESIDNIFLPDRLWQGQVAGNFSPEWLIQSINIAANIKKIRDLATGTSGSMKNISKKSMLDLIINVPTLEEQQKIGSFFKQLDDVIALHQLKLDLLKEQKKGFLQKMFA
ncbi:restriction endonuclease subunit S [Lactococcus lactis]|uniref:restriction endonuclease subunit S n=1 Tax=Lactococcus lactis TaxID=1358 RepID=UPI00300DD183